MIAQVNTLFFSPTDTTSRIIKQIADGLGFKTNEYDLSLLKHRKQYCELNFKNNDLLIVGVPVYSGRIPELLEDQFNNLRGNNTPTIFVVVYGNRDYDDALLELKNIFEERGFKGIAAAAFIGEHAYTSELANQRPNETDLSVAFRFGIEIKQKLSNLDQLMNRPLIVKGNIPYKKRLPFPAMGPQTDEQCIGCGTCAEVCPVEAIDFADYSKIDIKECIRCNSCVKNCPQNAKAFTHEAFINICDRLISNFSTPQKEPELFY